MGAAAPARKPSRPPAAGPSTWSPPLARQGRRRWPRRAAPGDDMGHRRALIQGCATIATMTSTKNPR